MEVFWILGIMLYWLELVDMDFKLDNYDFNCFFKVKCYENVGKNS